MPDPHPKQREDWIQAGIRALAREGIQGVRVDRLARALEITRGSFYWHFRDRADLLEAILREWEEETRALIAPSRAEAPPEDRLAEFFDRVKALGGRLPDAAIFMWARQDAVVAERVAVIEQARVDYLRALLLEIGIPQPDAERRVALAYLAFVGAMERASRDPNARVERAALLDQLLQLLLTGTVAG